jgi:exodeoxyribonuclease V alpha subunit
VTQSTLTDAILDAKRTALPGEPIDFAQRSLTAVVTRLRRVNEDFTILELDGDRNAVGNLETTDVINVGVCYRFFGAWAMHSQYGPQFRFESFVVAEKQNETGVKSFLIRGGAGLTQSEASKAWRAYGPDAIDVLRADVQRVVADGVLTHERALVASTKLQLAAEFAPVKIALFELFSNLGFPRGVVNDCIKQWGHRAPAIVRRDPFRMLVAGFAGVGFKRADRLYTHLGGNPFRLKRQLLGAWHKMLVDGNGNTWDALAVLEKAVLDVTKSFTDSEFERVLKLGLRARWLQEKTDPADNSRWLTIASRGRDEERLAFHLKRVMKHNKAIWPAIPEDSPLSPHQREELGKLVGAPVAILAGCPGVGKTFSAAAFLQQVMKLQKPIAVCAPTGKAAVRITEAMQDYKLPFIATTIHGLLGVADKRYSAGQREGTFQFLHDEINPLDIGIVVVDEASMIDTTLAASLFAAIPPGANVLIVGDPYQLPPVGHGAPLRDMIAAGVPTALLTEIKRNSGTIVRACHSIKDGARFETVHKVDIAAGDNLKLIPAETIDDQVSAVMAIMEQIGERGFDPVWDCQVLVATNDKSAISRQQLNAKLQPVLNKTPKAEAGQKFAVGDKVICLKNTWMNVFGKSGPDVTAAAVCNWRQTPREVYVANGDMGRVLAADMNAAVVEFSSPSRIVKVTTKKKRKAAAGEGDGDTATGGSDGESHDFDLAYAITVHKAQGSQAPVIVVLLDANAGMVANREWIYTGISRASKLCFLVGKMETAMRFVQKMGLTKRKTFLKEMLEGRL